MAGVWAGKELMVDGLWIVSGYWTLLHPFLLIWVLCYTSRANQKEPGRVAHFDVLLEVLDLMVL